MLEEDGDHDDWLEPVGGVVMEFTYPAGVPADRLREWEFWSFDYSTFDRFVDCVEQHEDFSHLMLQRPRVTRVYWQEGVKAG